jgi:hypothetical protein
MAAVAESQGANRMTNRSTTDWATGTGPPCQPGIASEIAAMTTRRTVLRAGSAAFALGVAGRRFADARAGAQETARPAADVCVLTREQTEGPYYLPLDLVRHDITEGKPGVPLDLRINVVDARVPSGSCVPLADAAVDIWHCDAQGYYSGSAGTPGGYRAGERIRQGLRPPRPRPSCVVSSRPMPPGWPSSRRSTPAGTPAAPSTST